MSSTPRELVFLIVGTLCLIAMVGMVTMAFALFYKGYTADPVILAAFIPMTSGAIGSLGTLLANTRQPPTAETQGTISTAESTKVTVEPQPQPEEPKP